MQASLVTSLFPMDALVLTGLLGITPPASPESASLRPPEPYDEDLDWPAYFPTPFYTETLAALAARYGAAAAPGLVEALRFLDDAQTTLQAEVMDNIKTVDTWLASDYRILAEVHAMVKLFDLHAGLLALTPWQEAVLTRCRDVSSGKVWFEAYD